MKTRNDFQTPQKAEIERGVELHKWRKIWMNRLISARLKEERLQKKPFKGVSELESYAETTVGTLLLLSLQCVNVSESVTDQAARNMARAIALTNSLRAQAQERVLQSCYTLDNCCIR